MPKCKCETCGNIYYWRWEDAFDKFGFNDGDGQVETYQVESVLVDAGYQVEVNQWELYNAVITSITKEGKELIPYENDDYTFGYDDARDFFPKEIIDLLDRELSKGWGV